MTCSKPVHPGIHDVEHSLEEEGMCDLHMPDLVVFLDLLDLVLPVASFRRAQDLAHHGENVLQAPLCGEQTKVGEGRASGRGDEKGAHGCKSFGFSSRLTSANLRVFLALPIAELLCAEADDVQYAWNHLCISTTCTKV